MGELKTEQKEENKGASLEEIKEVAVELIGEKVIPILEFLKGKKKISEFIIAEELELEIKEVRHLLYKLYEHNIVSFVREKDKIKGWYICYWELNEKEIPFLKEKLRKKEIEKLKKRIEKEKDGLFYMCNNACSRMDMDKALEFNFKCPECGSIMNEQDNSRTIEFLQERIEELEKEKPQAES